MLYHFYLKWWCFVNKLLVDDTKKICRGHRVNFFFLVMYEKLFRWILNNSRLFDLLFKTVLVIAGFILRGKIDRKERVTDSIFEKIEFENAESYLKLSKFGWKMLTSTGRILYLVFIYSFNIGQLKSKISIGENFY